jgi:hypothetical protein
MLLSTSTIATLNIKRCYSRHQATKAHLCSLAGKLNPSGCAYCMRRCCRCLHMFHSLCLHRRHTGAMVTAGLYMLLLREFPGRLTPWRHLGDARCCKIRRLGFSTRMSMWYRLLEWLSLLQLMLIVLHAWRHHVLIWQHVLLIRCAPCCMHLTYVLCCVPRCLGNWSTKRKTIVGGRCTFHTPRLVLPPLRCIRRHVLVGHVGLLMLLPLWWLMLLM